MSKFKVGDKVRCIIPKNNECKGAGWIEDEVFTISSGNYCYWGASNGDGVYAEALEKAFKYSFKKGDKVKSHSSSFKLEKGEYYEVLEDLDTNSIAVNLHVKCIKTGIENDYNMVCKFDHVQIEVSTNERIEKFVQEYLPTTEYTKEITMEAKDIKNFNPENLSEAKSKADEENKSYELEEAKKVYSKLIDERNAENRKIKEAQARIKELDKDLNIFGK